MTNFPIIPFLAYLAFYATILGIPALYIALLIITKPKPEDFK